jgi:hypothetical protein
MNVLLRVGNVPKQSEIRIALRKLTFVV